MDITITMLNGTDHTLRVHPDHTVGQLKNLIQNKLGEPPNRQKLVFENGHRIDLSDDSRTVGSYGLESGSRVFLLVTQPAKIEVFVLNTDGKTKTYETTPEESVKKFKTKVECKEGVAVSQQRLIFQGREMMDGKLSDYGVQAHSTIYMSLRLRGG